MAHFHDASLVLGRPDGEIPKSATRIEARPRKGVHAHEWVRPWDRTRPERGSSQVVWDELLKPVEGETSRWCEEGKGGKFYGVAQHKPGEHEGPALSLSKGVPSYLLTSVSWACA